MISSIVVSLVIHSSMSVTMSTQMSHRRSLGCSTLPAWAEAMIRRERATEYMVMRALSCVSEWDEQTRDKRSFYTQNSLISARLSTISAWVLT